MNSVALVSGDFKTTGGMDRPNFELARHLADVRNCQVHLVAHHVDPALQSRENITLHHVPKLAKSYFLSAPLLASAGRKWCSRVADAGGVSVVNGGNCVGAVNWVHYVHAAWSPSTGSSSGTWKSRCRHHVYLASERKSLRKARLVIANSERTRQDLVERVGIPSDRIKTVYYGIDPETFRPPQATERTEMRARMKWPNDRLFVAFVGALADRRKGFDVLFEAWRQLCSSRNWNADLVVMGAGRQLAHFKREAQRAGIERRIHFLGYRTDLSSVIKACDLLVAPTRYEAYGQGVHEALCCGVPAMVSARAGIAERYPHTLDHLLIHDPDDVPELADRLRQWQQNPEASLKDVKQISDRLREYCWRDMASEIVKTIESMV